MPKQLLLSLLLLCFNLLGFGQNATVINSNLSKANAAAVAFYNKEMGESLLLYNGNAYTPNYLKTNGHRYYNSDLPQQGSINYNDIWYHDVQLQYDLVSDQLLLVQTNGKIITLVREKVSAFNINQHQFINLISNDDNANIYELLEQDGIGLLAKRKKRIPAELKAEELPKVETINSYFILKENTVLPFGNKKELLHILKDQKTAIENYIKTQKIKFKNNLEEAYIAIVKFYNHTNQ